MLAAPPALAALAETLARPLFVPNRRPAPAPAATADPASAAAASEDPPPASRLIAVAMGPGRAAAVLQLRAGGTAVLMRGEALDGWTLAEIAPGQVVLRNGERAATLALPPGFAP